MSREFCPVEVFLEYISKEERLLQRLAHGESMQDIVREVQKCYKSKEGAKQATFRWLTREIRAVLERIFREEGELYSVPILETLKTRVKKSRGQRAKAWWYRRRKDSVFTVVIGDEYGKRGRYGAVRKFDAWKLERPGHQVWVEYPNGGTDWVTVS